MRTPERGLSLSTLVVLLLPVLFLTVGLVVDGGAQTTAAAKANSAANEAARAGQNAAASRELHGLDGSAQALSAAREVLSRRGVDGEVTMVNRELTVTTRSSAPTTFLSAIGINEVRGKGRATVHLERS